MFLHPRFWAEEGTSWFQYAASHSAVSTLFYVQPFTGYFNLIANLGAIAAAKTAAWFGLQFAPYATTILAFLIQIFVFAFILFGRSTLFDSLWKATAGCAIALFAATATDEIWLTTINVITYMGFISLVFLFERTWEWPGYWKWVSRGMLALCALSSPYSAALVPLFVILTLHGKYKEQRIQSAILIACLVVQAGVCVDSKMHATAAWGVRAKAIEPAASFITVFCEDMVRPALGDPAFNFLIGHVGLREAWTMASSFPPPPHAPSAFLAAWICSLLAACILWTLKGPSIFSPPSILIAAFLSICALVSLTAMESTPLGRYAFLPGAIFLLLLVLAAESCKTPAVSFAILMILSLGLANGVLAHIAANTQQGPSWSTEVSLWRADHSHSIRVWPEWWVQKGGAITLR